MRESQLERYLVQEVKRIGGRCPKWTAPGEAGVPDRIVILPNGRIAFVEMKSEGKKLRPLQERWFRILRELGHYVRVLDSVESIDEFIKEISV